MEGNTYANPGFAGGNREWQTDILTILEPEDCPLTSMARKGPSPKAVLIETLADTLRKPRVTGTREGMDAGKGANKSKDRQRFGTRLQRIMDTYGTTDIQEEISNAGGTAGGVTSQFAYDKAKTLREMKRDMEAIACSENEHFDGSEAEMKTRGAFTWLEQVGGTSFQTADPKVPDKYRPLATSATGTTTVSAVKTGASSAFTEDDLNLVLQALQRQNGAGKMYQGIFGDNLINKCDHFTRTNQSATTNRYMVQENAAEHQITMTVKLFQSTQGTVAFIPTQFNRVGGANGTANTTGDGDPDAGLVLMLEHWHLDFLIDLYAVDGQETAGGRDGYAKAVFAFLCNMPRGSGKITA